MLFRSKAGLVTMTLYLAHELKPYNIAANILLPHHTRTTGSDEQDELHRQRRLRTAPPGTEVYMPLRAVPAHVVPLALHLAEQDSEGTSGQVLSAMQWNEQHGLGDIERWAYPDDLVSSTHRRFGAPAAR